MTDSDPRPIPHITTSGFATTYLTVPAGSFLAEWHKAKTRLHNVRGAVQSDPELLHILGQANLAARLQLRDFRGLIERVFPSVTSEAIVANTVFSTPYVIDRRTIPARTDGVGVFRFMTHIRVRRSAYRIDPVDAESVIIDELRTLTDIDGADVAIDAGVGWADFVLSGTAQVELFDRFLRWLVEFNDVNVNNEGAFKRTLTLIGYPWASEQQEAPTIDGFRKPSKAMIFIRARRGRLAQVKAALRDSFVEPFHDTTQPAPDRTAQSQLDVGFVDGKMDVVAVVSDPQASFFQQHQKLFLGAKESSIERMETHLMFDVESRRDDAVPDASSRSADCRCDSLAEALDAFVAPETHRLTCLPIGTATAIRNIGFLSSSTIRDPANCCDARPAIVAIWRSLRRLVERVRTQKEESRAPGLSDERRLHLHRKIKKNIERIDLWMLSADRVLRQRTVGSFEEFLGQSDRALSYGGGVQKGLLVADWLMNEFYAKMTGKPVDCRFAAVFDSVDRIMSIVRTGIVRIPVPKAFHLPGSLPDLWHEVGCYEFFRVLPVSRFSPESAEWYRDLADYFGDLVSLVHGFDLNFPRFAAALVHGWYEWKRDTSPLNEKEQKFATLESEEATEWDFTLLLNRLVAALEFHRGRLNPDLEEDKSWVRARAFVYMERFATEYLGKHAPRRHPDRPARTFRNLRSKQADFEILRAQITDDDIAKALARADAAKPLPALTSDPAPLVRFEKTTDLNATFRDLYLAIEEARDVETLQAPNAFAQMAALSRSAAIEYYRRTTPRA